MPDPNSIADAAADRATASPFEGSGALKDAVDLATKVRSGDWAEGLLALGSIGYETKEYLKDPLAKLTSMGLGWVIEWFGPLRWIFDQLTGDQEQLNLIVETWSGIAGEMTAAADELDSAYATATARWSGPAVAQYRLYCANQVDLYRAAAAAAESVSDNARLSGAVLTAVREVVRGLITDAAGKAISIFCRYPPPATPAAAPEISTVVVDTGNKIVQWLHKLKRAFANAHEMLGQSGRLFSHVRDWLKHANATFASMARRSAFLADVRAVVGIIAKGATKQAVKEIPKELAEATAVESAKAGAAAAMAGDPEPPPDDQNQLYDGPGPHRVTGTL